MKRGIRIVAPFRPFPPESELHQTLADFDWIAAIRMMMHSAQLACGGPVHVITDVDTELPVSCLKYVTTERRLMLWTIEAGLRYLESDDFDRNTVMLDCDQLVYRDLAPWFCYGADLTVLMRPNEKHTQTDSGQPILNGVQWFTRSAKRGLVAFYQRLLETARRLPESSLVWGGDTEALRIMLEPIELGIHTRHGVTVHLLDSKSVLESFSAKHTAFLKGGVTLWPQRAVMDFRHMRKPHMRPFYEATILAGAVTS